MEQFEKAIQLFRKIIITELENEGISCWIAGGALRDYFKGEDLKADYDIFFPNEIEYEKAKGYFIKKHATIKYENEKGIKLLYNDKEFDLVKEYFKDPKSTIECFDYTISMFAVDGKKIYHGETAFIDLAASRLIINQINYPFSTLCRAFRHYQYGFTMHIVEMEKLANAIRKAENDTLPMSGYDIYFEEEEA